ATFHDDSPTCDSTTGPQNLDERLTSEYALAGLNEGFADFIAFSALGTTNVLGSYEFTGDDRSLTRSAFDFRGIGSECVSFYCLGTLFARSLYDAYVSLGNDPDDEDARGAFSREIVMALAATQETMAARDELPPADPAASECDLRLEISSSYDAQVTAAFLAAFLDNLTGEIQAQVCDAAASNFGSAFPANAGVCP
ncbi:MAG: hypothetical protein KJO07_23905, partial [Deltaproteobacteria bacterium]|nr:hypothetical protein [Deltaproteobacteria bacterium]